MTALDQLLQYCKNKYESRVCSTNKICCVNNSKCISCCSNNCEKCLNEIHNHSNKNLDYECLNQTYYYVMKFTYRYATEIFWVLQSFLNDILNHDKIKIASIGCGPSTELYGLKKFTEFNHKDIQMEYVGFDKNRIWSDIQNMNKILFQSDNIQYLNTDAFDYIKYHNDINILILNYVLSDLARHDDKDSISDFTNQLIAIMKQKKVNYILINDVYLTYETKTAYAILKILRERLNQLDTLNIEVSRYQYKEPNIFQTKFGHLIPDAKVVFQPTVDLSDIGPRFDLGSLGVVIKIKPW